MTWLAGNGFLAEGAASETTPNFVTVILFALGLLSRQLTYGPVTVGKEYRKKEAAERDAKPLGDMRRSYEEGLT